MVDHDEVHKVFSKYNTFLFSIFSEYYGHVIADALIVGTSAITSEQTPWRNIKDKAAGWTLPLMNPNDG